MKSQGLREKTAVLTDLRARLARLGRARVAGTPAGVLPLGAAEIAAALPSGGLPSACVHEIAGGRGAVLGFALALLNRLSGPVLWCAASPELYGPGLAAFGFDPRRLLLVRPRGKAETLWAMEEGLRCGALSAAVAESPAAISSKAQRRLQLAAERGGVTGFFLRGDARNAPANFFATSWRVTATTNGASAPRWTLELTRCRGGRTGSWLVEWTHETGDLAVAAPPCDRPHRAPPGEGPVDKDSGAANGRR